jgi:hypothetical protein
VFVMHFELTAFGDAGFCFYLFWFWVLNALRRWMWGLDFWILLLYRTLFGRRLAWLGRRVHLLHWGGLLALVLFIVVLHWGFFRLVRCRMVVIVNRLLVNRRFWRVLQDWRLGLVRLLVLFRVSNSLFAVTFRHLGSFLIIYGLVVVHDIFLLDVTVALNLFSGVLLVWGVAFLVKGFIFFREKLFILGR